MVGLDGSTGGRAAVAETRKCVVSRRWGGVGSVVWAAVAAVLAVSTVAFSGPLPGGLDGGTTDAVANTNTNTGG